MIYKPDMYTVFCIILVNDERAISVTLFFFEEAEWKKANDKKRNANDRKMNLIEISIILNDCKFRRFIGNL